MELGKVFVDSVIVGSRHRALVPAKVEALAESIDAIGLQQPISVYIDNQDTAHLIAGHHRLEAARKLGWEEIDASFVRLAGDDRELWEIDENLCRAELTEAEEAAHLKRRKEIWEARLQSEKVLPIESKRADGKGHRAEGFASETAAITGQTKQTINNKIARAEAIAPDVLKEITGSRYDKGVVLDILKKLTHAEQKQALFRVKTGASSSFADAYEFIKGDVPKAKPVSPPPAARNDEEVFNAQLSALVSAWNRAGKDVRQHFIEHYLDTPVFDRGAA